MFKVLVILFIDESNNGLPKKICSGQMDHFWPENGTSSWVWLGSKNFLNFLQMKGANRYMKILLVVFWEKKNHLEQSLAFRSFFTVWLGMVKLCHYASLFECKGHWMLKAYKLPCVEQRITKLDWKRFMYSVLKLSSYFCVSYFLGF